MVTTPVTREVDEVVCEIFVAAPPERVFEALISPEQILEWWRNDTVFLERAEFEPRLGGRWGYETKQLVDGKRKFEVHGEVLVYEPPRLLAYTWIANVHEDPLRRTVVRWELTPARGGTQVKLTHNGLANEQKSRSGYSSGWPGLLERLGKFVQQ